MTNQLIAYDKVNDVPAFINQLGRSIAVSKMFGCESEEQGHVIALECMSRRMPPMSIAERYHLIHGKLSKKSEAMLAEFREVAKGTHKIIRRDAECVAIELITADRQTIPFQFTWEEAVKEPFVYEGKESTVVEQLVSGKTDKLKLKSKYATPRSRMQMLWSRLVSDSIRCVAPEIVCGTYTPEEVSDFESMPNDIQNNGLTESSNEIEDATIVDVQPVESEPKQNGSTVAQMKEIYALYLSLGVSDTKQLEILKKRGCDSIKDFTTEQAEELLVSLREIAAQRDAETNTDSESKSDDKQPVETESIESQSVEPTTTEEPSSIHKDDPCMPHQVQDIKDALSRAKQQGAIDIIDRFKALMTKNNIEKIADLTHAEALKLFDCIEQKAVEAFFESDLRKHCPKPADEATESKEADAKNSTGEQS